MDENISRAAGASHGQGLEEADFRAIVEPLGRTLEQRTTLYGRGRRSPDHGAPAGPLPHRPRRARHPHRGADRDGRGHRQRGPRVRDGRVGGAHGSRGHRPRRPQARQRRAQGAALLLPRLRALHRRAQGLDLRLGPPDPRRARRTRWPATSAGPWPTATGWSSPAPAPGSWRPASRAPGAEHAFGVNIVLPFEQDASPLLAGDPEAHQLPLLLHPQAHLHEGVPGLRPAARRVRHHGRGLRAAHAHADRPLPDRAGRAAGRAGQHLLGDVARVRRPTSSAPGGSSPTTTSTWCASPTTSTRPSTRSSASTRRYHSMRFVGRRLVLRLQPPARPTPSWPASTATSPTSSPAAGSSGSRRPPSEIDDDDVPDLPRVAFRFDRMSYARLRRLIDRLNGRAEPLDLRRTSDRQSRVSRRAEARRGQSIASSGSRRMPIGLLDGAAGAGEAAFVDRAARRRRRRSTRADARWPGRPAPRRSSRGAGGCRRTLRPSGLPDRRYAAATMTVPRRRRYPAISTSGSRSTSTTRPTSSTSPS